MSKFGKREALRFGWDAAIQYIGFFVVALLSMWVVSLLLNGIAGDLHRNTSMGVLAALFSALASLIGFLAHMGFIKIGLKIVHGHAPSREDFIPTARQFWTYLGAAIVFGLIVGIGFILLIIPGIIFAVAMQFYPYFVIEKGMMPLEALKASAAATKGERWNIFVFDLVLFGITILGALALGVGLFVALPTILVANAFVYRKLAAS
jgi:uncharacterized membrane protein